MWRTKCLQRYSMSLTWICFFFLCLQTCEAWRWSGWKGEIQNRTYQSTEGSWIKGLAIFRRRNGLWALFLDHTSVLYSGCDFIHLFICSLFNLYPTLPPGRKSLDLQVQHSCFNTFGMLTSNARGQQCSLVVYLQHLVFRNMLCLNAELLVSYSFFCWKNWGGATEK